MSLVGPRPPLPSEVANYDVWHRRRLSMKPGMTGLWQVDGRNEREFDRWVETDLEYIDTWSLWLDFKIIARTVPAVLAARVGRPTAPTQSERDRLRLAITQLAAKAEPPRDVRPVSPDPAFGSARVPLLTFRP